MSKPPTQIQNVRVTAAGKRIHASGKGLALQAVRPSAAARAAYQTALDKAVGEMHRSLVYWIKAHYRAAVPMAQDASPARELRATMRKLGRRWLAKFDVLAPKLAAYFATAASERVDGALEDMLRRAGFTVRFKMSKAQKDAYSAVVEENVSLIKSVAQKHLAAVEGHVLRSVSAGRDLGSLASALEENYGVTKRRAALIAKTQNNMATATLTRTRQKELGIRKARWLHSSGGKMPRPEHVAFSGKVYDVDKGAFLEGKWTWPGMEINCRCVSVPFVPGFDD